MNTPLPPPPPKRTPLGDPLLDERLARLAARRSGDATSRPATGGGGAPRAAAPTARATRRHAARGSRAAALALSVTTTVGLAGFFRQAAATEESTASSTDSSVISSSSATIATVAAPAETTAVAPAVEAVTGTTAAEVVAVAADTSTGLADGTYTGDTSTNRWGPVQVEITVSGGVITDVSVLQYPDDDHKSVEINERALPTLIEEALAAQSSDVDTVSGATYTSDSYRESLQTAIDAARAAITA